MWSDNETEVDLLRFQYLASAVIKIVKTPHLLPTTIGVFGDWGSGKSSLLKIVEKELVSDPAIMCLSFNGWLFEGFEDAKTALMGTILDEIQDRIKKDESLYTKAKNLLVSLKERVNWMQLLSLT
jgi:predicted KAP-like P-loop ATPase